MSVNHTDFVDAVFTACGNGGQVTREMQRLASERAADLGLNYVSPWRRHGVPSHWRVIFAAVATQVGVEIPDGFLPEGLTLDHVRAVLVERSAASHAAA